MSRTLVAVIMLVGLIAVPRIEAGQSNSRGRAAVKPAPTSPVNINTASVADLETLPGIGAKTAGRIIEYRQKNGPFKRIEELMNVRGIGEKNFLKLKPQISIGGPRTEHAAQLPQ